MKIRTANMARDMPQFGQPLFHKRGCAAVRRSDAGHDPIVLFLPHWRSRVPEGLAFAGLCRIESVSFVIVSFKSRFCQGSCGAGTGVCEGEWYQKAPLRKRMFLP